MELQEDTRRVVLSPHLDDAVFGVWHSLVAPGAVKVVTVFAGIPEPGFVTALDREHGASESAAWVRRRRTEDRAALAVAGRAPHHLDLLDVEYVVQREPDLRGLVERDPARFVAVVRERVDVESRAADVVAAVRGTLSAEATIYAPVGIGGHPDHRAVGRAAMRLASAGHRVRLWADSPYFLRHGVPSWLDGRPNQTADELVGEGLAAVSVRGLGLTRHVIRVDGAELDRKIEATLHYETEYAAIKADFGSAVDREMLALEVVWTVKRDRR